MSISTHPRHAATPRAVATLGALPRRKAIALLSLFFVPGVGQAILLTVVPLEALQLLGNARAVTLLYVAVGLVAVIGRFSIPFLVRLINRRFVFSLGALSLAVSAALMAADRLPALAIGLALSIFATACIEVTSQLYLLDNVSRNELRHFEPLRIFTSAGPFTLGPWFGVYLQSRVGFAAPFEITMAASVAVLALFWVLRLGENAMLTSTRRPPPSPARYLVRFFAQPRLRLAWTLAVGRNAWWSMLYVYVPIFAVTSGTRRASRRRDRLDWHRMDLAGAALGLGRPALRAAPPAVCRIRACRLAEHRCRAGIQHPLAGRRHAGAGGVRH